MNKKHSTQVTDMMDIKCLQSGSMGNSYAVDDGETVLLLEAGIQASKIVQGYMGLMPRATGCLITHEHVDHAKSAAGLAGLGIDLYASKGTFEALGDLGRPYRCKRLEPLEQAHIGSWVVLPFPTEHDAAEPFGFLLYSQVSGEKVLFATDTHFIAYQFSRLTAVMVECNYSLPLLEWNVRAGKVPPALRTRLMQSHFSLEDCKEFLEGADLSRVHDIYLLHRSKLNGDRDFFYREIVRATGVPVTVF